MKTITILIPLSLVLFALSSSANSAPDSILDTSGKILRTGTSYFVVPAARVGTGITLVGTGDNNSCPGGVAQFQSDTNNEPVLPLTFSPVNTKKGVIRLSTDVNIKFTGPTTCDESNVWRLEFDESVRQYFVMAGGVEGNPGQETLDNWFKIEKSGDGYKFVFCPSVCIGCRVICRDVGIYVDDNGIRRLALSDVPFSVVFMR